MIGANTKDIIARLCAWEDHERVGVLHRGHVYNVTNVVEDEAGSWALLETGEETLASKAETAGPMPSADVATEMHRRAASICGLRGSEAERPAMKGSQRDDIGEALLRAWCEGLASRNAADGSGTAPLTSVQHGELIAWAQTHGIPLKMRSELAERLGGIVFEATPEPDVQRVFRLLRYLGGEWHGIEAAIFALIAEVREDERKKAVPFTRPAPAGDGDLHAEAKLSGDR